MSGIILSVIIIVILFFVIYAFIVKDSKLSGIRNINTTHIIQKDSLKDIIDNNYYMSVWYNIDHKTIRKPNPTVVPTMDTPKESHIHEQFRIFKWPAIPKAMYNEYSASSSSENCAGCDIDPIVKLSAYFDKNLKAINIYLGDEMQETYGADAGGLLNTFINYQNTIKINDVPLYGWNNLIISVNQTVVDVYINGELRTTRPVFSDNKRINKILNSIVSTQCLCIGDNNLVGNIGNIKFGKTS